MDHSPIGTCLGIAGPIGDRTRATITNYEEDDRDIQAGELSAFCFPPEKTFFVNDLEGTCAGILALNEEDQLGQFYQPLWNPVGETPKILRNNCLVLAMGTGLGTGIIVTDFSRNGHHIFPIEAGHILVTEVGFHHECYSKEREMIQFIGHKLYEDSHSIEFEDICSGRGIGYVNEWLTGETVETGEIIKKAKQNDEKSLEVVSIVYRYLIRNAQTLCVMSQAKSVYLSGDNQVTNMNFVLALKDMLHNEFLNHPKREWLEHVDVWTQSECANFNIFGVLYLAKKYTTK